VTGHRVLKSLAKPILTLLELVNLLLQIILNRSMLASARLLTNWSL